MSATASIALFCALFCALFDQGLQCGLRVEGDDIARAQTGQDFDAVAFARAGTQLSQGQRAVLQHVDAGELAATHDRLFGHTQHRIAAVDPAVDREHDFRGCARRDRRRHRRQQHAHGHAVAQRIGARIDDDLTRIHGHVVVEDDARARPGADRIGFGLRHLHFDAQIVGRIQRQQRLPRRDRFSRLDATRGDDARIGCAHDRVIGALPCGRQLRTRGIARGVGRIARSARLIELRTRNIIILRQQCKALVVALGLDCGSFRGAQLRTRRIHARLLFHHGQAQHYLPGDDAIIHIDIHCRHPAAGLRRQHRFAYGFDHAVATAAGLRITGSDDMDFQLRQRRIVARDLIAAACSKEHREPRSDERARRGFHLKAHPPPTPIFLKRMAAGQMPVKLACTRFRAMKAVNTHHHGETKWVSARLIRIIMPAKAMTARSRFMFMSLLQSVGDRCFKRHFKRHFRRSIPNALSTYFS